ncbi:MAG: hypothetical protein HYV08_07135 [Deltaproteobacteria bacterium]|nr:hypothetical protein [Deltaproteobacteria bacterium]MBI3077641.1 hypothetical protein [Deltaproteobacteria bacterium]
MAKRTQTRKEAAAAGASGKTRYRCVRCGYILYVDKGGKAPGYCPNCAVVHLKGEMVRMT